MNEFVILNSRHLENMEGGSSDDEGYKHSSHKADTQLIRDTLTSVGIKFIIWDESDITRKKTSERVGPGVIIVPSMRVCSEEAFQKLLAFAAAGWLVFTSVDAFYYTRSSLGRTRRVQSERTKSVFLLYDGSSVSSRLLTKGSTSFPATLFGWLTQELPIHSQYSSFIQAIVGEGQALSTHGRIEIEEAVNPRKNRMTDTALRGKTVPAFAIREYPSGGLFIYACFNLVKLTNFKQIFQNIARFRANAAQSLPPMIQEPASQDKQTPTLRGSIDKNSAARVDIIQTVKTPLGFFTLVVLVVEVILGIAANFSQGTDRTYLIVGMLSLIFLLVIIVAGLAVFRPEALSGQRPIVLLEGTSQNLWRTSKSNEWGIKITSHDNHTKVMDVSTFFELSGTYEQPVPEGSLPVFVLYENDYWPAMRPGQYVASNGVWRAQVSLGGKPGPRLLLVTVIGKTTQEFVKKYWQMGDSNDDWRSLKPPIPDLVECDRVIVNRL